MIQTFGCMIYACTLETSMAVSVSFLHGTTIQPFPFYFRMYCSTIFTMGWLNILFSHITNVKRSPTKNVDFFLLLSIFFPYCVFCSTDTFLAIFNLQTSRFQNQIQFLIPSGILVGSLFDTGGVLHYLAP